MTSLYLFFFYNILGVFSASIRYEAGAQENTTVVVSTCNGLIRGVQGGFIEEKPWYRFRGIPFAEPPVGSLRFEVSVCKILY